MKAASVKELKTALTQCSPNQLVDICLRLARFKKENKELLTYLLFEAADEEAYIKLIKETIDDHFDEVNTSRFYYIKKGIRKALRETKKYIRYSGNKETEIRLLLYFCRKMRTFSPSVFRNRVLQNMYETQITLIRKKISSLHEDLQYDYGLEVERLV